MKKIRFANHKKRNSKKGFWMLEKSLEIVLAIASILVLVGIFVLGYSNVTRSKDLELAKASLEHLISEIEAGRETVDIYNPKDWGLVSFVKGSDLSLFPSYCLNRGWIKCICICPPPKGSVHTYFLACLSSPEKRITCSQSEFSIESKNLFGVDSHTIPIVPPMALEVGYSSHIIRKKEEVVDDGFEATRVALNKIIEAIENKKEVIDFIEIKGPEGWMVSSWKGNNLPKFCSEKDWKSCICMCAEPPATHPNFLLLGCDKSAVCFETDYILSGPIWDNAISIEESLVLRVNHDSKTITLPEEDGFIP